VVQKKTNYISANNIIMLTLLILSCILTLITIALIITLHQKNSNTTVIQKVDDLSRQLTLINTNLKDDFKINREETNNLAHQSRKELSESLQTFRHEMTETLRLITQHNKNATDQINKTLEEKIGALITRVDDNNKTARDSITTSLKDFSQSQQTTLNDLKKQQKEEAEKTVLQLEKTTTKVEEKMTQLSELAKDDAEKMRLSLEKSYKTFGDTFESSVERMNNLQREKFAQLDNKQNKLIDATEKKLEQMRETVDEKLQKTLNERLGQSFEMVRGQLESVQKGLGEMQTLAQDVGGLKRVLSNVKMRGGFGEVQLQMLLENILAPEQYEKNVATKKGSTERVEFAVKFPNREEEREYVWLPIDAKFLKDAYEAVQTAYDTADVALIEAAQKALEVVIRKMAKDICEKYIDALNTTNFGIMFLPFEGLFAEVVRKASLLEDVQRDCKVIITGPTTLAVILNSLQIGFRTLAIQKRSSEVWQILGAVKKEFNLFGGMLDKAQKNIQTGLNQLDDVVGKRTKAIQRQLRGVEDLQDANAATLQVEDIATDLIGDGDED
jgi:DNA recombination protein RmuC